MSGQATSAMLPRASDKRAKRQAQCCHSELQASDKRAKRATSAMPPQASDKRAKRATSAMLPRAATNEPSEIQAQCCRERATNEPSEIQAQCCCKRAKNKKNRPQNEVGFRLYVSSNYSASVSATTVKATLAWISLYNLTTAVYSPNSLASFITMLLRSTSRPNLANSSATWMLLTEP